jgi:hypothetical protein
MRPRFGIPVIVWSGEFIYVIQKGVDCVIPFERSKRRNVTLIFYFVTYLLSKGASRDMLSGPLITFSNEQCAITPKLRFIGFF